MTEDPTTLAAAYFRAWQEKDFATLQSVLADNVTFRGSLGTADGADTCIEGMKKMAQIMTDIDIHKTFVDGPDVLTWYDMHTTVAPPSPTANWIHIEDGKITAIRATFDAGPFTAGAAP
jgi:ketosteroid isomerase-like protein